jgi:Uma2 family endonuclease
MLHPLPHRDEDEDLVDYDTFCALIPDGQKADLIDGVIYVASPDSYRANALTSFLCQLLGFYNSHRKLGGEVMVNRFAYRISEFNAPEPDVSWIQASRKHLIQEGGMLGGPDVAIEIVARESRDRDFRLKRALYASAGVEEYWLIDYLDRRCEFLHLADGQYEPIPLEHETRFRSRTLPGFWLHTHWLLQRPLPDVQECLAEILAG